jgi:hypothetical protein
MGWVERLQQDPRPPPLVALLLGTALGFTLARFVPREHFLWVSTGLLVLGCVLWIVGPRRPTAS